MNRNALTLLIVLAALAACDRSYFYVGDRKVDLHVSDEFVAVASTDMSSAPLPELVPPSLKPAQVQSPILVKHDAVLFRVPTDDLAKFRKDLKELVMDDNIHYLPIFEANNVNYIMPNSFSVQLRRGADFDTIERLARENDGVSFEKHPEIDGRYTFEISWFYAHPNAVLSTVNRIHQDPDVDFSTPAFVQIHPADAAEIAMRRYTSRPVQYCSNLFAVPDDPFYCYQWALKNVGSIGTSGVDINAEIAWSLATVVNTTTIAILDNGVDISHPDLQAKIVAPYNAIDPLLPQDPAPWDTHGTAVAGIAGAVSNNGGATGTGREGIAAVAWDARILPVKIGYNGRQGEWQTSAEILESGIRMAVKRGARVLNGSWTVEGSEIGHAVDYAITNGAVMVFSAGNFGTLGVKYPAKLSVNRPIIAVSATNQFDEFKDMTASDLETWGSSFGPEINVAAPGVRIYTTDIQGTGGQNSASGTNGDYNAYFNGTSAAAPLVSGTAALLLGKFPGTDPACIRDWIERGALDLGDVDFDIFFGHGRLDAGRSIQIATDERGTCLIVRVDFPAQSVLASGDEIWIHATATRNGKPLSNQPITFSSSDPKLAQISPQTARYSAGITLTTNSLGTVSAKLRGETWRSGTVKVSATIAKTTISRPVRVPALAYPILLLGFAGILAMPSARRQRIPKYVIASFVAIAIDALFGFSVTQLLSQSIVTGTVSLVVATLNMLGVAATAGGGFVTLTGEFSYEIVHWCTGIWQVMLYTLLVATTQGSQSRKAAAILIGAIAMLALNLIRLVHLFFVGIHAPEHFAMLHHIIWPAITFVAIGVMWAIVFRKTTESARCRIRL